MPPGAAACVSLGFHPHWRQEHHAPGPGLDNAAPPTFSRAGYHQPAHGSQPCAQNPAAQVRAWQLLPFLRITVNIVSVVTNACDQLLSGGLLRLCKLAPTLGGWGIGGGGGEDAAQSNKLAI